MSSIDSSRSPLSHSNILHQGFNVVPDPFAPRRRSASSFVHALLSTALFRCWHILLFFAAWSTLVTVLNNQGHNLFIQPTLLTVIGTVLGFVISYRTTSSFERYNEGRRLWSQIILASRTFARTVWFHVPDYVPTDKFSEEEMTNRALVEKKTIINLLEAFAVAVKHYLRGEDGIYYQDLYYLVKFLPAYALPPGLPLVDHNHSQEEGILPLATAPLVRPSGNRAAYPHDHQRIKGHVFYQQNHSSAPHLPAPVTSSTSKKAESPLTSKLRRSILRPPIPHEKNRVVLSKFDEDLLLPARIPPRRGVNAKKAAKLRAKMQTEAISHNLPLEISLYLSSYIASLQKRKACDVPTTNIMFGSLTQLVDGLTGLERILTTPIPFSYSIHLWLVTVVYCLALIWLTLHWFTIPGTIVACFIFFGFLVAGEEIENPFGYDKNDLNLDHFTNNIIRNELRALTSTPPPDPARWAFVADNDLIFSSSIENRITPGEWLRMGSSQIYKSLRSM